MCAEQTGKPGILMVKRSQGGSLSEPRKLSPMKAKLQHLKCSRGYKWNRLTAFFFTGAMGEKYAA